MKVIQRHEDCDGGAVYRVQSGAITGYVLASDTRDLKAPPMPTDDSAWCDAGGNSGADGRSDAPADRDAGARCRGARRHRDAICVKSPEVPKGTEFSTVAPVVSAAAGRNAGAAVATTVTVFIMGYIFFALSNTACNRRSRCT